MLKLFKYTCITRLRPYPEEEENNKISETSLIGNKITQDLDNMSKESKVGISIEGKKFHQY